MRYAQTLIAVQVTVSFPLGNGSVQDRGATRCGGSAPCAGLSADRISLAKTQSTVLQQETWYRKDPRRHASRGFGCVYNVSPREAPASVASMHGPGVAPQFRHEEVNLARVSPDERGRHRSLLI